VKEVVAERSRQGKKKREKGRGDKIGVDGKEKREKEGMRGE